MLGLSSWKQFLESVVNHYDPEPCYEPMKYAERSCAPIKDEWQESEQEDERRYRDEEPEPHRL